MKFSLAATAVCALSSVSAAPFIERRATTVVGTIDASVGTVNNAVTTNLATIGMLFLDQSPKSYFHPIKKEELLIHASGSSVAVIKAEPNAYTAIAQAAIAAINASARTISTTLTAAAGDIIRATTTATGELNTQVAILAQSEIDLLARDVDTIKNILTNINATVTVVSTLL